MGKQNKEQGARDSIDRQLSQCGWLIQIKKTDPSECWLGGGGY